MTALITWLIVGGSFGQFVWKPYLEPALNKQEKEVSIEHDLDRQIEKWEKFNKRRDSKRAKMLKKGYKVREPKLSKEDEKALKELIDADIQSYQDA